MPAQARLNRSVLAALLAAAAACGGESTKPPAVGPASVLAKSSADPQTWTTSAGSPGSAEAGFVAVTVRLPRAPALFEQSLVMRHQIARLGTHRVE